MTFLSPRLAAVTSLSLFLTLAASPGLPEPPRDAVPRSEVATSDKPDAEEVAHLEALVKSAQRLFDRIDALERAGVRGGEVENWGQARLHLAKAKARLACAKGDSEECVKQRTIAVEAAKDNQDAIDAAYDAGTATLDLVIAAQIELADARIALNRLQRTLKKAQPPPKQ